MRAKNPQVISTDRISKSREAIAAEDLAFIPSQNPCASTASLFTCIESILRNYLLSAKEIADHLGENETIHLTELEISSELHQLISAGLIKEVVVEGETLLQLEILPKSDRQKSKRWYQENTTLNHFYDDTKVPYINIFKELKYKGINSYNQVCDPIFTNRQQVVVNGKTYIQFTTNDYLGLTQDLRILDAAASGLNQFGHGSCGSRILSGTTSAHRALELELAKYKGCEDAVLFNCGFMTNLAAICLLNRDCIIIYDALSHASLIDGIRMSGNKAFRFKHNDLNDLEKKLCPLGQDQTKLVVIEGIYSMDGDIGKADEISELCKKYNAYLLVDEAHSAGTIGENGKGVEDYFNMPKNAIDLKIGTLGKAFAAEGGYIATHAKITDMMKYTSRPFLFSTSLPASVMEGARKALDIIQAEPERRIGLQKKSEHVRRYLMEAGFDIGPTESHIIPVILGDNKLVHEFQAELTKNGLWVNAVMHPAVAKKQARLRISLCANHHDDDIRLLLNTIHATGKRLGVV